MERQVKMLVIKAGLSGMIIGIIATTIMVVALTIAGS